MSIERLISILSIIVGIVSMLIAFAGIFSALIPILSQNKQKKSNELLRRQLDDTVNEKISALNKLQQDVNICLA